LSPSKGFIIAVTVVSFDGRDQGETLSRITSTERDLVFLLILVVALRARFSRKSETTDSIVV